MYYGLGTIETIVRLLRLYKVLQKANPTILRSDDIVRLALFLYVKQCFMNKVSETTLLLARFLHINRSASTKGQLNRVKSRSTK